jgi:hypothetical protein
MELASFTVYTDAWHVVHCVKQQAGGWIEITFALTH